MTGRIDRTERLLNLVICLMAAPVPVPRATIERDIPGYGDAASASAFERMFERDKDELRSMGIPVETVSDASGEVLGYRISREHYELPPVELTVEERAAVAVAAQVWGQAVVGPVAGVALRKLESLGDDWTPADIRGSVQLTASDAALLPLMTALRLDRVVTFPYRTPAEPSPITRTVSPWVVRSAGGGWFLVGHDHDREAVRTFRLSRVTGPVTVTTRSRVQPPPGFQVPSAGQWPGGETGDAPVEATVRVRAGAASSLRRRARGAQDRWTDELLTIPAGSWEELVPLVCAAGPDAVVVAPPELIDRVRQALDRIQAAHGAATAPGGDA